MTKSKNNSSRKQILKATGILGGVQIIDILLRVARMKIIAILLGPSGVGIIGLYNSIIALIRGTTGFGLEFSSVREIAQANAKGDKEHISRTIIVLRRWVWFTGLVGMLVAIIFSKPISKYTFGDESYAVGIIILSVVMLLTAISEGQLALLQGLRQIKLMAKAKVGGLLVSFVFTVPLYWLYGFDGIVPAILISASIVLIYSWLFARQVDVEPLKIGLMDTLSGGIEMCRLGFIMVLSGLISITSMYLVRAFVANNGGLDAVGLYQSAWAISSVYMGAVLQAMGSDYFPRLSAVSHDNKKVVTLVNEQTEIALLIVGPMVVGMLSFVGFIVIILFSSEFSEAVLILHWMLGGTLLKVISWPLGFIMLAKGRGAYFITAEFIGSVTLLVPVYFFWNQFGLQITGMAFTASYLIYVLTVYIITNRMCGFVWSRNSKKLIALYSILTISAFINSRFGSGAISYVVGSTLLVIASLYSLYELNKIIGIRSLYKKLIGH